MKPEVNLRPQPTSSQLVRKELATGFPTNFQLVRLVGCGL